MKYGTIQRESESGINIVPKRFLGYNAVWAANRDGAPDTYLCLLLGQYLPCILEFQIY